MVPVDTGLRALELCSLKVGDIEIKRGKVEVKHGIEGGTKDGKGRMVYLGKVARRAFWLYLAEREDGEDPVEQAHRKASPADNWRLQHLKGKSPV